MQDPVEIALLSALIFLSEVISAVTGFGGNILFHLGYWSLVSLNLIPDSGVQQVVVYITLNMLSIAMVQALYYRQYVKLQPKFAIIYVSINFITTTIGIEVLVRTDSPTLTRIFGVILFITFLVNFINDCVYPRCGKKEQSDHSPSDGMEVTESKISNPSNVVMEEKENTMNLSINHIVSHQSHCIKGIPEDVVKYELKTWRQYCWLMTACTLQGISRGIFGAGGPPMIIYMLITNIDRRIVRSLTAFAAGFGGGLPLIVNLLIIKKQFDATQWVTYCSMFIMLFIGLVVGNAVHSYVNQEAFRMVLMFILFCGSINLMLIDMGDLSMYSSLVLMILFLFLTIGLIINIVMDVTRKKKEKEKTRDEGEDTMKSSTEIPIDEEKA